MVARDLRRPSRAQRDAIAILAYAALLNDAWEAAPGEAGDVLHQTILGLTRQAKGLAVSAMEAYRFAFRPSQYRAVDDVSAKLNAELGGNGEMHDTAFLAMLLAAVGDLHAKQERSNDRITRLNVAPIVGELLDVLWAIYAQLDPNMTAEAMHDLGAAAADRLMILLAEEG